MYSFYWVAIFVPGSIARELTHIRIPKLNFFKIYVQSAGRRSTVFGWSTGLKEPLRAVKKAERDGGQKFCSQEPSWQIPLRT